MNITNVLFSKQDILYRDFTSKLIPTVPYEKIIGVRAPDIKAICKEMSEEDKESFIAELPHTYLEENILHGCILSKIKDADKCLLEVERFLPYIDNWAVNDTVSPKALTKKKELFIEKIKKWTASCKTYTVRFGVSMLMKYFLDADFKPEYNGIVADVVSDEYYVNMMCGWYFATALAKQYEATVPYLENRRLTPAVHKMTVRKAVESFRIDDCKKAYLKTLRLQ